MNTAEIKLELFRWLDQQNESMLKQLHTTWISKNMGAKMEKEGSVTILGYEAMSQDKERENEASEWLEGTLNHSEL